MVRPVLKALISQSSKTLKKNNSSSSKSFFTLCSASQPSIYYNPRIINNPFLLHQHHFNFRPHFLFPLSSTLGPLFFSSPPWKLSQSATPLLLCDVVSINLPKVRSALYLPYTLGLQSSRKLLKKEAEKHNSNDDNAREYIASKLTAAGTRSGGAVRVADSYLNIPNFISFTRLLSGPLLGWMIVQEMYLPSFVGLAISGATDWLDGYMARKMGINSVVGSYLDPLADKVLIGFVALAMVDRGLLHPGLVSLVVLRDVALIGGAVYKRGGSLNWQWKSWSDFFNLDGTQPEKIKPLLISKVNTVLQLVLVAAALLQPEFGNEETRSFITYLSWLVAFTTIGSTAAYGAHHLKNGSTSMSRPI
ncbi:hypothetical protein M9H77_25606 [Catharanthus roseus]|uniref:Uncharacterized protein n=1 Tax=Catharanthus roseus TaxID=4058 RepID=A0ACC0ABL5_CATRO|nr:hypothetical protein M9H77_25606 [Catharanthus roseus]